MTTSFLDAIKGINPQAMPTCKPTRSTYQKDTLQKANSKVANKYDDNRAFAQSGFDSKKVKKPDLVYVERDGEYFVGGKYGNKWLKGLFDGEDFCGGFSREQLIDVLKILSDAAKNGDFSEQVNNAMNKKQDN